VSTGLYGFALLPPDQLPVASSRGWIAVPLVLQFFIAATSNAVFAINTTLVADLCPGLGASATAINNLVRCGLGALGVGLIDILLEDFGPAASFLGLAILTVAMAAFLVLELTFGMRWRNERLRRPERAISKA
jgi:hypothetical protein